jgi:hypothetical protein
MWETIRQFAARNPELVSVVSLGVGFASIVLALILYRASKPRRLLAYATRTFRIISGKAKRVKGLKVLYNEKAVPSLSLTRLGIWNAGNEALRRTDIPSVSPPVIHARKGVSILEAQILETTSSANRIELTHFDGEVSGYAIGFEFLDPGDGALFNIVHDGIEVQDVAITGGIIGGRIRRAATDPETLTTSPGPHAVTTMQSGRSSARSSALVALIVFTVVGIFIVFINPLVGFFLILLGGCLSAGVYLISRRSYPPPQLKMFDDNLDAKTTHNE